MNSGNYVDSNELGTKIDALKRIPLKTSIVVAISLSIFFTYYDISNYAYISPVLKTTWKIGDAQIAYGGTMFVLGYVIGALCIAIIADYYGRKPAIIIAGLILGISSFLVSISQDMTQFTIFRLLTGVGIGSEIVIVGTYIGEISPKAKRGRYTSIIMALGWVGVASSGPISFLLLQTGGLIGMDNWRIIMLIPGVIAFVVVPFRSKMPESPRWLLSKGKIKDTNKSLQLLGIKQLDPLIKNDLNSRKSSLRQFINIQLLLKILFLICIWFLILVPVYASLLLVVEYVNQGYSLAESISINTIGSIGFLAGGLLSILIADKLERKHQFAVAGFVMGISFILRGILITDYTGLVIASFLAFASNAWLVNTLISYTAENFATKIRTSASGIIEGCSRALAATGPIIFVLFRPFGFLNLMIIISLFSFIAALLMMLYGRRTSKRSLEELINEKKYENS